MPIMWKSGVFLGNVQKVLCMLYNVRHTEYFFHQNTQNSLY